MTLALWIHAISTSRVKQTNVVTAFLGYIYLQHWSIQHSIWRLYYSCW